jgi:hypothetical protein
MNKGNGGIFHLATTGISAELLHGLDNQEHPQHSRVDLGKPRTIGVESQLPPGC